MAHSIRTMNRFRKAEVKRLLQSVHEAGRTCNRIEVDPNTGKVAAILGTPESSVEADVKVWDTELKRGATHEAKKRAS